MNIDRVVEPSFKTNLDYNQQFPNANPVVSIKRNTNQVVILFDNGLSVQISIGNATGAPSQQTSWLIVTISFLNNLADSYTNKLLGLMGNFNGIKNDDLISRSGILPTNITLESSIYPIASNCM